MDKKLNINQTVLEVLSQSITEVRELRTDSKYQELRQLTAVANYHAVRSLKVSTKVAAPINRETIPVVCTLTGITVELIAPKIPGFALTYENPLAKWVTVRSLIQQKRDYLNKLDSQVLAGLWLTSYKHYDLLASKTALVEAVALNSMLRTAGKTILIDGLELINHIHSNNKNKLPQFSLDYNAHKEFTSVGPALQEYNKVLRNCIYPGAEDFYLKSKEAKELAAIEANKYQDNVSYVVKAKKTTSEERAFKERFIANRREAKAILARMVESRTVPTLYILKLKPVFIGENLSTMDKSTRTTVAAKLRMFNTTDSLRLAVIVEEGQPSNYDGFDDVETNPFIDDLPTPTTQTNNNRKKTLAEILAAKKGTQLNVEATSSVPAAVITEVAEVKISYTEEDEIRHLEIEEALDAGNIISEEDAKWNAEYLQVVEAQEFLDSTNEFININHADDIRFDISGEEF